MMTRVDPQHYLEPGDRVVLPHGPEGKDGKGL